MRDSGRMLALLPLVSVALLAGGSSTAVAASMEPVLPCYVAGVDRINLAATGFAAGSTVDFKFAGQTFATVTADGSGRAATVQEAPRHPLGPRAATPTSIGVAAVERGNESNSASTGLTVANVGGSAQRPGRVPRPDRRWTFRGVGFFAVEPAFAMRPVFMHWVFKGRARTSVRVGRARPPCGSFTKRFARWPLKVVRKGTWIVALQTKRRYSPLNYGATFRFKVSRTYRLR